jgi:hypothetical protein
VAWSRRILFGIAVSFCAATALTGASESEPALMARALLFGFEMPPPPRSPASLAQAVTRYRDRERTLKTRLGPPPPGDVESANYSKHVGLERSLYALFDRDDSAEMAAAYAAPARLLYEWEGDPDAPRQEAEYAEEFLAAHPETPLAPYLHLFAGHREMCAASLEGGKGVDEIARSHLLAAGKSTVPLIRYVADFIRRSHWCNE